MRIAVPREREGQPLVAAAPQTVALLIRLGYEVLVERGAGLRASFPDSLYEDAGASLVDAYSVWAADVVIAVDTPNEEQLAAMRPGATLIARLAPQQTPGLAEALAPLGITALAMDAVPRISRAQAMDVLSSQANIAGYRAVVEAANHFGHLADNIVISLRNRDNRQLIVESFNALAERDRPASVYVIGDCGLCG